MTDLELTAILGHNVKRLRQRKGLSVVAFADLIGVDKATVFKTEGGNKVCSLATVAKFCDGLDATPTELFR